MLEVDAVLRVEVYLRHRDKLALDLAGAAGELELDHVAQPRGLAPAGVADLVLLIERSAAGLATGGA